MATKKHHLLTPTDGVHPLQGFTDVADEAARAAVNVAAVAVAGNPGIGGIIRQTGGVLPGFYAAIATGAGLTKWRRVDVDVASGFAFPFNVLDFISVTPLTAFHSFYKLRTAYAGSAFRVRRASDNTETDIGFFGGVIDVASLQDFCGASNGFVVTWYDQSGNGNDVTQATAAAQPQIWSGALLNFVSFTNTVPGGEYHGPPQSFWNAANGPVPQLSFDGVDDELERADGLGLTGDVNWSRLVLGNHGVPGAPYAGGVRLGDNAGTADKFLEHYRVDGTNILVNAGGGARQWTATQLDHTSRIIFTHAVGASLAAMIARQNGVVLSPVASLAGTLDLQNEIYEIGHTHAGGHGVCKYVSVMEFNTELTSLGNAANLATLEAWMKAHRVPT
jgi:hypothetical protein